MTAVAVLTRRFLVEYVRNPVNLLVLVLIPVVFVLVAAEPMADAAKLLGGTGRAVETATTGWAAAFLAALAMYFQTRQARSADRRLVLAGLPTWALVVSRMSTGLLIAVLVSAAAMGTLFLRTEVDDPLRVAAGALMFAVIYVGIGAAVGSLVKDPVNGTVVILLIWILDVFFGPALTSPDRVEITRWTPTHFVTLWMVDLPSGHGGNLGDLGIALVWVGGALLASGLLLARATQPGRRPHGSRRPGWAGQAAKSFRMGLRQYRRNPALWILLVTVPVIFIWLSKLITEEQYSVMRVLDDGREVDLRFWLPDTHAGTMAPIAVASLATVAGLFIALNNRDGDRRLVQSGMHRSALLVGRLGEVGVAVVVTAAASLAITAMVFPAKQWAGFIGGMLLLGVIYALLGMCLGFLLGRVTGVLIAFVVPFLDLGITQSPMLRLEPPGPAVLLPSYGPYRVLIDTGLTDTFDEVAGLVIGLLWVIGLTLVVVLMFVTRTSSGRGTARKARHLRLQEAAAGPTATT
ncbi:ABC transporter permease [Agromyces bauzanensis]